MKEQDLAIQAVHLSKHYRGAPAEASLSKRAGLNDFNLSVASGSICGLLGPNGAGKTTAIKILTTLLALDTGQARVAGYDVTTQSKQVRERISLVGQSAAVDEILTGRQNLVMFGQLNHLSTRNANSRADELLEQFGLAGAGKLPVSKYSGGMRRRLDLAASLIVSPEVLFVDEPTAGLDPVGRKEVWEAIRSRVADGTTVLLTTQYLEEADQLADRITILEAGHVIAEGSPDELKSIVGGDRLDIQLRPGEDLSPVVQILHRVASGPVQTDTDSARVSAPVADRTRDLIAVANGLFEAGIEPQDIQLRRPTLDEVFIHLTGQAETEPTQEARP